MKFTCEKDLLISCINASQRAVSSKSLIPALEGLLIEAKQSSVKITGFDMEMGIVSEMACSVEKEGALILNAKIFGEIIRKLPNEEIYISSDEKLRTTIRSKTAEFTISGIKPEDYPELPKIDAEDNVTISQARLKSAIGQTLFAVSLNDAKPVHTGSLFEIKNGALHVISVDGYRLALRKETMVSKEDISFIIPGKTLSEVEKILKADEESNVTLQLTKKHVLFEIDNFIVISRLLEGDFLNYQNAIPQNSAIVSRVYVKELIESVERASLLISERNRNPIRMTVDDVSLVITCTTPLGHVHDEIQVEGNGGAIEIGFNNRYLLEALKASDEEQVDLCFNTPLTPCVVRPIEGDSFLFLVLPVKLKSNE